MKKSDNKQKALIHICKQQLVQMGELSEQGYRDTLRRDFDVTSSTELTYEQATRFINDLKIMGAVITPKRGRAEDRKRGRAKPQKAGNAGLRPEIVTLPSPSQMRMIELLRQDVQWRIRPDGYERWIKAFLRKERITTGKDASKVIEALKAMIRRQQFEGVESFHDHAGAF